MRIYNKNKVYYEQFNNYQEFVKIVEERDKTNAYDYDETLRVNGSKGKEWVEVKSYDEAKDLLMKGWDAKVEEFKQKFDTASKNCDEKKVLRQFNDVVGFMPIVPSVLIGLPNCMINQRMEAKKTKIIKFLLDTTVSCSVTTEKIMEFYSKVLARIAVLERKGYRCRIEMFQCYSNEPNDRTNAMFSVMIKNECQPFDIKRMAFPLAHPAMFRVFGFAWENSLPIDYKSYHCDGMGTPMYHWGKKKREKIIENVTNGNEKVVYISYKSNLDEIFGKEVM